MRILLIPCLLLAACSGERIEPAPKAGDRLPISVEWRVVDRAAMEEAYRQAGRALEKGDRLHGFAGVLPDGRAVVYTLPPQHVDDAATCTLGHEILHVTHGDYHQ